MKAKTNRINLVQTLEAEVLDMKNQLNLKLFNKVAKMSTIMNFLIIEMSRELIESFL